MAKITIEFDTENEEDMVNYKKAILAPSMYLAGEGGGNLG
jgi:hypothetical protein